MSLIVMLLTDRQVSGKMAEVINDKITINMHCYTAIRCNINGTGGALFRSSLMSAIIYAK